MKPETILLRQAHPNFVVEGKLTSQAFYPFPKDDKKLSVYDGDQITPADSFQHFTQILGNQSICVWGVTCAEATTQGLASCSNPLAGNPAHALIDFTTHDEKAIRKLSKRLKILAVARGCLHPAA